MAHFKDVPIKRKLTMMMMITTCFVLVLSNIVFLWKESKNFKLSESDQKRILSDVVGPNSSAALAFGDKAAAEEILSALKAEPHIVSAALYGENRELFAEYHSNRAEPNAVPSQPLPKGESWSSGFLEMSREISLNGKVVGHVYIKSDLERLKQSIRSELMLAGMMLVIFALLAYIISGYLVALISKPIMHLVDVMQKVSTNKDYSLRAVKDSNDEIGTLIAGFNDMLSQVHSQDQLLKKHRDTLEEQVTERTIQLKASEAKIRSVVNAAADGIITFEASGKVESINSAATEIFGYNSEEFIGKHVSEFIPRAPEDANKQATAEENTNLLLKLLGIDTDIHGKKKDGSTFPLEISVSEFHIGTASMFVGIMRDITVRKAAELALKAAKDAAEAANQAKSDFLANMSHEIRTPMNGIIGMTDLTMQTELTPQQKKYLGIVKKSATSLLGIINDILDFSKIEAGKLEVEFIDFNLREHLNEIMRSMSPRFDDKQIELLCRVAPNVPDHVTGDPLRLRQVLINLIGNACKFTEKGEVVVNVELLSDKDNKLDVKFSVRDTGIGIPAERLNAIFEAFSQADTSTTREYGGTGLGLTISTQLAELMGGKLGVTSKPGEGSTFFFNAVLGCSKTPQVAIIPAELQKLTGMRVLIVDDNQTNRTIMEEIVKAWNMFPICVDSAYEALHVLEEGRKPGAERIDMIISDFDMPRMNGLMFIEELRKMPTYSKTPIIVLSSADRMGSASRCKELGVCAYLLKPVMEPELLEVVRSVFGMSSAPIAAIEKEIKERLAENASVDLENKRLSFLIAEDNPVNQELIITILTNKGHRVVLKDNGAELIKELESCNYFDQNKYNMRAPQDRFDLILMDIQMPKMGGVEATGIIREREKNMGVHMPIIALTAHAMKGDRETYLNAGMDEYTTKPINVTLLFNAIKKIIPPTAGFIINKPAEPAAAPVVDKGTKSNMPQKGDQTTFPSLAKPADRMELLMELVRELFQRVDGIDRKFDKLITNRDTLIFTHSDNPGNSAIHAPEIKEEAESFEKTLTEVIDLPELIQRVDGNAELMVKLCEIFLSTHAELLMQLKKTVDDKDFNGIHRVSHNLKGVLANLAAKNAFERAYELTRLAREEDFTEIPNVREKLDHEVARVSKVLKALCESQVAAKELIDKHRNGMA